MSDAAFPVALAHGRGPAFVLVTHDESRFNAIERAQGALNANDNDPAKALDQSIRIDLQGEIVGTIGDSSDSLVQMLDRLPKTMIVIEESPPGRPSRLWPIASLAMGVFWMLAAAAPLLMKQRDA